MKHKCCVKGCDQKGLWLDGWEARGAYCRAHKYLLTERRHNRHIGRVHEGNKVGKPRSWASSGVTGMADADA